MIKFENVQVMGWEPALRGMRNALESWDKADSYWSYIENEETGNRAPFEFFMGEADHDLAMRLAKSGSSHAKFRRMINVYVDITAPLYWWKEFDTYKVGTVANSCSTMHKIQAREFTPDMFSTEHLLAEDEHYAAPHLTYGANVGVMKYICNILNYYRECYLNETDPDKKKELWWQMIQLLPSSYNQKRTIMLNYETLAAIYKDRFGHKQDEWSVGFMEFIESLPHNDLIKAGVYIDE